MIENCNICLEISREGIKELPRSYHELIESGRNIIWESQGFLLIPSFGPLNDSHVMLVPKRHVNSFAQLTKSEVKETRRILSMLKSFTQKSKGEALVFFESGAGTMTSHSGGCIVHAHIHCVTGSKSFDERLKLEIPFQEIETDDYSNASIDTGYVWYRDHDGRDYICNNPMLPSQFLRYIYAQTCGSYSPWNWRRDINPLGILQVIKTYKDLQANKQLGMNNSE